MSQRNFGIMSGPASLRGVSTDRPATRDAIQTRDFIPPLPASSILHAACPPFKRGELTQTLIDVVCVFFGLLLLFATAASIPLALFLLLFVNLH